MSEREEPVNGIDERTFVARRSTEGFDSNDPNYVPPLNVQLRQHLDRIGPVEDVDPNKVNEQWVVYLAGVNRS